MFLAGHTLPLGFLLARWLRLPHPHHPDLQGITSSVRAFLRGEQVHASPTELDLGGSGSSFMLTGHTDAAVRLGRPGFPSVEQMIQYGLDLLLPTDDTSILDGSDQDEGPQRATP